MTISGEYFPSILDEEITEATKTVRKVSGLQTTPRFDPRSAIDCARANNRQQFVIQMTPAGS